MEERPANDNAATGIWLGLVGALVVGVVGHFAFLWIARQGFYALALPGALAGLGGGWLGKSRSRPLAIACGLLALGLGIFSEWSFAPFMKDTSLGYFLAHLQDLRPVTLLMIVLGGVFGFWFARGGARRER